MEKRPRIGMYSPYVPEHAGGGERHFFSVAEALQDSGDVEILLPKIPASTYETIRKKYEQTFQLDLKKIAFRETSIGKHVSAAQKLSETAQYDVLYYLTDGSLFFSLAKRNVLHIQFPFQFAMEGAVQRLKLANWGIKNANSDFTRKVIEKAWHTKVPYIHYPYVDTSLFQPLEKEKIIVSVGRFFTGEQSKTHSKQQHVLVETFKRMVDSGKAKGWKLVLIGTIDPGSDNKAYAEKVAEAAKGHPIKIFHEASFDVLRQYYAHASIYWHAAGFGIDEEKEPTKVEHFGISILEAMACGAVPVVVHKGGAKEIITEGENGFFWNSQEELIEKTEKLMKEDSVRSTLAKAAQKRATYFSKVRFVDTAKEMFGCK